MRTNRKVLGGGSACLPFAVLILGLACGSGSRDGGGKNGAASIRLETAFPGLTFRLPVAALQAPADSQRWFVVEKGGTILALSAGPTPTAQPFIDISDRVESTANEAGLLGMAFDPAFPTSGEVILSYTAPGPGGGAALASRISRFRSLDGGTTLGPATEEILLTVDQPFTNHNGGQVAFGPDGFLYIGLGDGGSAGDPQGHGQNTQTLLGAMLRLDVAGRAPYAIPASNPFAQGGGRPEIFAWGFRNPWRWSFDRATGELWCGDVGQGTWEEVDRVVLGRNYGWNIREGAHCFGAATCNTTGLEDPVAEYSHADGCSITGGYVYRGKAIPNLVGTYLYGDFCSGTIWGLTTSGSSPRVLLGSGLAISSFAEGNDGELYVVDYSGGAVYRLIQGPQNP